MTNAIAIIGGSGLDTLAQLQNVTEHRVDTPYGEPSAPLLEGDFNAQRVIFLPRHGINHTIPPHRINYRANIAALATVGVSAVLAVTAVGGISSATPPGRIVIPHQIIDYTYGREHSFSDGRDGHVEHIDFTHPYSHRIRDELIAAAASAGLKIISEGVYGATQGPRLESAAEITGLARDGCTIVGMTGMPEAALAREAGLEYACCSLVVNWAAGIRGEVISIAEIRENLSAGMNQVLRLVAKWLE